MSFTETKRCSVSGNDNIAWATGGRMTCSSKCGGTDVTMLNANRSLLRVPQCSAQGVYTRIMTRCSTLRLIYTAGEWEPGTSSSLALGLTWVYVVPEFEAETKPRILPVLSHRNCADWDWLAQSVGRLVRDSSTEFESFITPTGWG